MATVTDPTSAPAPAESDSPSVAPGDQDLRLEGPWRTAAVVIGAAVIGLGLVFRFWTHSPLWLDEALTVNIAERPLSQLHMLLRQDGAPPLYYVLLHFWMKVFGTSNLGVRSLSGVISVITLPLAWLVGRQYGRQGAWALVVLLASAPFAIYYGTEARMYALVMLLTTLGLLALRRAMRQPRPGNLIALAVVTAALLYSQYWAIYLVASVVVWLLWQGRKADLAVVRRTNARWSFGAVAVGCLAFVPWLPTFFFQSRHTGTPWAAPGNFGAIVSAITGFTDNQATLSTVGTNEGRLLAVLYLIAAFLAVFGVGRDRWHIDLDLHTRPRTRAVGFVVLATLLLAVGGGIVTNSGYSNRYASVVFVPFLVLVALGVLTLRDPRARVVALSVAAAAGLWVGSQNVTTERTQAAAVTRVLSAHAKPGDIVAYCPDQLGPSVWRLTSTKGYRQITYPRSENPAIIDWVDYQSAVSHSRPKRFVRELQADAGSTHSIWLVWAPGYQGYGIRCETIAEDLLDAAGYGGHNWVVQNPGVYYQPMSLTQYVKLSSAPAASAGR